MRTMRIPRFVLCAALVLALWGGLRAPAHAQETRTGFSGGLFLNIPQLLGAEAGWNLGFKKNGTRSAYRGVALDASLALGGYGASLSYLFIEYGLLGAFVDLRVGVAFMENRWLPVFHEGRSFLGIKASGTVLFGQLQVGLFASVDNEGTSTVFLPLLGVAVRIPPQLNK